MTRWDAVGTRMELPTPVRKERQCEMMSGLVRKGGGSRWREETDLRITCQMIFPIKIFIFELFSVHVG